MVDRTISRRPRARVSLFLALTAFAALALAPSAGAVKLQYAPLPTPPVHGAITVGNDVSCGVTSKGAGSCWGNNNTGQGTVPSGHTWAMIDTSEYFTCGVTTEGEGLCWGADIAGATEVPPFKVWKQIVTGVQNSCGVTTTGEGICWGQNGWGQSDVPVGRVWRTINPGSTDTCGITTSGQGICWGFGSHSAGSKTRYGVIAAGDRWISLKAGPNIYICGVTTAHQGICRGEGAIAMLDHGQMAVPTGHNWASISPGYDRTCGVTVEGAAYCFGSTDGSLTKIPFGRVWDSVDTSERHSCGVTTSGYGYCWGASDDKGITIPAGNPFRAPVDKTAPKLTGNPKATRVGTLSTIKMTAKADFSGVETAEYSLAKTKPSTKAAPVTAKSVPFASTITVTTATKVTWLRVKDGDGNWSTWYAVK